MIEPLRLCFAVGYVRVCSFFCLIFGLCRPWFWALGLFFLFFIIFGLGNEGGSADADEIKSRCWCERKAEVEAVVDGGRERVREVYW